MKTPSGLRPWVYRVPSFVALTIVVAIAPLAVIVAAFSGAWKEAREVFVGYGEVIVAFFSRRRP